MKLLSVVSINYNTTEDLKRTLASLGNLRKRSDIELVVVDGGSSDGIDQVFEQYAPDRYVSEPDYGIYNAMNKGIALSSGRYIAFLNAGDTIVDSGVSDKLMSILEAATEDIISFGKIYRSYSGEMLTKIPKEQDLAFVDKYMPLIHQGLCVASETYSSVGGYDEQFRIVADSEWLYRYLITTNREGKSNISFQNFPLVEMERGGVSDSENTLSKRTIEHYKVREKHGVPTYLNIPLSISYFVERKLKYLVKRALTCFRL